MIKILTSTQEEYGKIKTLIDGSHKELDGVSIDIRPPQGSIASVVWSIEDVRKFFPENASDELIEACFRRIEGQLVDDMIERGWDTIIILADILTKPVEEDA